MAKMRTNCKQFDFIVNFMEENEEFARGQMKTSKGLKKSVALWRKLAANLNKYGPPIKEFQAWRKVWYDMKENIRKKLRMIARCNHFGGQQKEIRFSSNDERIINLLSLRTNIMNPRQNKEFSTMSLCSENTSNDPDIPPELTISQLIEPKEESIDLPVKYIEEPIIELTEGHPLEYLCYKTPQLNAFEYIKPSEKYPRYRTRLLEGEEKCCPTLVPEKRNSCEDNNSNITSPIPKLKRSDMFSVIKKHNDISTKLLGNILTELKKKTCIEKENLKYNRRRLEIEEELLSIKKAKWKVITQRQNYIYQ